MQDNVDEHTLVAAEAYLHGRRLQGFHAQALFIPASDCPEREPVDSTVSWDVAGQGLACHCSDRGDGNGVHLANKCTPSTHHLEGFHGFHRFHGYAHPTLFTQGGRYIPPKQWAEFAPLPATHSAPTRQSPLLSAVDSLDYHRNGREFPHTLPPVSDSHLMSMNLNSCRNGL